QPADAPAASVAPATVAHEGPSQAPSHGVHEAGPGAPGVTRLSLHSTPPKAHVVYRGTVLGETPIELEVPEGSHRFELSKPGYHSVSVTVEGRGSQALTHEIPLEPLAPSPPEAEAPGTPTTPAESAPSPAPPAP
ncbi:MAG: PEGA domain-containing protein, partial [Deltaproteobacteria bacterium]